MNATMMEAEKYYAVSCLQDDNTNGTVGVQRKRKKANRRDNGCFLWLGRKKDRTNGGLD
jgi:hypothetical protein